MHKDPPCTHTHMVVNFLHTLGVWQQFNCSHVELHCYTLVLLVLLFSNEFKAVTASVVGVPYTFPELQARAYDLGVVISEHI